MFYQEVFRYSLNTVLVPQKCSGINSLKGSLLSEQNKILYSSSTIIFSKGLIIYFDYNNIL